MNRITTIRVGPAYLKILLLFVICFSAMRSKGQITGNGRLNNVIQALNNIRKIFPVEKLYLQFDKIYYFPGDTLRFKAYLLNADFLTLSAHSGLLYAELDGKNNSIVRRMMIPVASGLSWGTIPLDEKDIPEGYYTLHVYTNWMRNFGEDYIFKKSFYIASASAGQWLVTANALRQKEQVRIDLRFTGLYRKPVSNQLIQLHITDGIKSLYNSKATTAANGELSVDFPLPDKMDGKRLVLTATAADNGKASRVLTIPLSIKGGISNVKFMPEGGTFVAGISTVMTVKASGEDGRGQDASGYIFDSKRHQIVRFSTLHHGIGSFKLTPASGETYTAAVMSSGGTINYYPLPAVATSGTCLKVEPVSGNDSLRISLRASTDLANNGREYDLMAVARGIACYAAVVRFKHTSQTITVPSSLFPSGITRFTLLDGNHVPLNDRMIFIDHRDNLEINIQPGRKLYGLRDSIALQLKVNDKTGSSVQGSFSIAVTDDTQIAIASMEDNIVNRMLLTSDLKEPVEEPGYYFADSMPDRAVQLDNVMLTDTWLGYQWRDVFGPVKTPAFAAEHEFMVSGKVTNLFNKPVPRTQVILLSKKPLLLKDTSTDENGRFVFNGLFPVDTALFLIQAKNTHGKHNNISIALDEFKPPVFTGAADLQDPWYVNTDTVVMTNVIARAAGAGLQGSAHLLAEVKITGKKTVRGSKNLNGAGEADQVLDETDMNSAGKITLRMLLAQKIKGFTEGQFKYPVDHQGMRHAGEPVYRISYKINEKEIRFVFDGIDLDAFYYPPDVGDMITPVPNNKREYINSLSDDRRKFVDTYLDYYTAEDIKGIEVMSNDRYNANYINKFLSVAELTAAGISPGEKYAYIEITTRSGSGPFLKNVPGSVVYKPLAFSLPKPFYGPRYSSNNSAILPGTDLRSIINWDPNIIVDGSGKSVASFFSADKPGRYTITIEGADINGDVGYKQQHITIIAK